MKIQIVRVLGFVVLATAMVCSVSCTETSNEKIQKWRIAAEQGDADAQFELGWAYDTGEGIDQDYREAVRWYREAAEQGNASAQYNLGVAYGTGEGIDQDYREAVRWYREAAEQGNARAQYNLGVAYGKGEGIDQDRPEAVRWYRKAAEQGNASAQNNLGVAYSTGEGIAQDHREAIRWHRKAAKQGNARAQNNLGLAYKNGEGVAQDHREAMRWYRKAAGQGIAWAQYNLGVAYSNGKGVAQNHREAVRWYRKAAEQGIAWAQYNLGRVYFTGEGIDQDYREAVRWSRKAAEQGDADAQYNLGVAYTNGQGVIEDRREAYIWHSIAKANGSEKAANNLQNNEWGKSSSQSAIRAAQKEAARRMDAIANRPKESADSPTISENIAIATTPKGSNTAEKVFENTWRSVVVITNGKGHGSGVIIRPNIVATNCHVVDERGDIAVYKSKNRRADTDTAFLATIRRSDENKDFCLLDVDGLWGVPATVRKYETLKVGEDVYGLGAPKGLDLSISSGLVSQLRTSGGKRYIQTDAAISPGSSGGGLFDSDGNLVGFMSWKIADESVEGIGFAIPADLALGY